jgi:fatty-acyl-CoA synthase
MLLVRHSKTLVDNAVAFSSPALLVYTSGTTGRPKGALHTQANLYANMAIAVDFIKLNATNTIASMLPLFHVGGLCIQTLPALCAGATVLLHERFDATQALRCFEQERPSTTLQVPATMKALIEHADWQSTDLSSLKNQGVWAGSSTLPIHLVQAFQARGVPVCNVYGSTETGPFSLALTPAQAMHLPPSCGWPVRADVQVKLLEPHRGVGEIAIQAPNVAEHYWPQLPLKDADGYFHTGDLGKQNPDGSFEIVGRSKDMLISGGENIYPAELENIMSAHPQVTQCAVLGLPDSQWGEVVAVCLVLKAGAQEGQVQQALSEELLLKLARYKQPKRWFFRADLPKTALGKVQKEVLRTQLRDQT